MNHTTTADKGELLPLPDETAYICHSHDGQERNLYWSKAQAMHWNAGKDFTNLFTADQMREYALANMNRHAESELLECRGAFEQVFSPLHPMHRSSAFPDEYMDTFTQGMWIAFKSAWSRATTAQAKDGLTDDEITALAVEYEIEPSDRLKRSVEFDHPSLIKFARAIEQRTAQATPAGEGVGLPVVAEMVVAIEHEDYDDSKPSHIYTGISSITKLSEELPLGRHKLTPHATATAEIAKRDAEIEIQRAALENIRLFAARNRKEDWGLLILGFCAEGGVAGNVLRDGEA